MPRYVILRHEKPPELHFDLMLERDGVLKTWSLAQPPELGVEIEAEALPDHRLAYLDYEGPISGDRGFVTRWDRGNYDIERESESEMIVRFAGEKLVGRAVLCHVSNSENSWRLSVGSES